MYINSDHLSGAWFDVVLYYDFIWFYDASLIIHKLLVRILQILEYGRAMKKARSPHDFHGLNFTGKDPRWENQLQHDLTKSSAFYLRLWL